MPKKTEQIKLVHNPRCSTSQKALKLLSSHGKEPEIFLYLEEKITQKFVKSLVKMLGIKAEDLVRKKEKLFKESYADKTYSQAEWIKILANNPKLIERPIVIYKNKAAIGRPLENILKLTRIIH